MTAAIAGYVTVSLTNSDKQSNGCRTAVESKSNPSCDRRITGLCGHVRTNEGVSECAIVMCAYRIH